MSDCRVCESIWSASAPGGCIHSTDAWFVDHCIGPLGVGTLIVKPRRHVVHVADLLPGETRELGAVLQQAAAVVTELERPEQVYVTLWSHADRIPQHLHWVVQPITTERIAEHGGAYGPGPQLQMFRAQEDPEAVAAAAFAERARDLWPS